VFDAHIARRMTVHGDGEQHRPVVHIDKVVSVLAHAIEHGLPASTVDLVDRTMAVSEIVEAVKAVYPDVELLFVNQHMRLLDLKVRPDPSILALFGVETPDLEAELRAFKGFFSF
jgi:UDP-glucose 4-epimerase